MYLANYSINKQPGDDDDLFTNKSKVDGLEEAGVDFRQLSSKRKRRSDQAGNLIKRGSKNHKVTFVD